MHFSSLSDFLAMGGYAAYVWPGIGLVVGLLIALIIWSKVERKATFNAINEQLRIAKLRKKSQNSEMTL